MPRGRGEGGESRAEQSRGRRVLVQSTLVQITAQAVQEHIRSAVCLCGCSTAGGLQGVESPGACSDCSRPHHVRPV